MIKMSKYKKLIANLIIFAFGNLTVKLSQFFIMPILTSYLSIDEYGLTETLTNLIELIMPIVTLGIAEALFRFSIDKNNTSEEVLSNGILVVVVGSGLFSLLATIAYFISSQHYILYLIPFFIILAIKKLVAEFTRGLGKTVNYSIGSIIEAVGILSSASIFLIVLKLGTIGYILSLASGAFLNLLFLTISTKPFKHLKLSSLDRKKIKTMLLFSIPTIPNMLSWWLVQMSNRYILIGFCGITVAGLFMAAGKIPALVNVVSSIFLQAWSLSSAQESKAENRNEFYSEVFKYYQILIMLAVCVTIAISSYVSKFLLKGDFYAAWIYTPLLIYSAGLGCFSSFFGAFYSAYYKTHWALITTVFGALASLILSFSLIPIIGVIGALISSCVGYALIVLSRITTTRKMVSIKTNWVKFICILSLLLLQAIIYTLNKSYAHYITICVLLTTITLHFKPILCGFKIAYGTIAKKFIKN